MIESSIFRPYNVRGRYPAEINEDAAYLFAQAFVTVTDARQAVVGRDARLSGPSLQKAVTYGFLDTGVDVVDLGMITTDELYFAAAVKKMGGIQISASHNPPEWNGLKFIKKGAVPLTDDELAALYREARKEEKRVGEKRGTLNEIDVLPAYVDFLMTFVDPAKIKPLKVVANPLNGTAGPVVESLSKKIPADIIPLNMKPDGNFPKGNPDPFLPEMRGETSHAVRANRADLGVSWDNDADRALFFDETGEYVPGAFTTATLARYLLQEHPGSKIISECGILWPVKETVEKTGGQHILNRRGHPFLKARMRQEDALYGGENSGHNFFKKFWYADNGFIPLLYMLTILSNSGKKLSELVAPLRERYFFTEEINFSLEQPERLEHLFAEAEKVYREGNIDRIGGFSATFQDWRFHLHPSDNEPLLRLLVEARNSKLLEEKTAELTECIRKLA